jgi:hypothetical protein
VEVKDSMIGDEHGSDQEPNAAKPQPNSCHEVTTESTKHEIRNTKQMRKGKKHEIQNPVKPGWDQVKSQAPNFKSQIIFNGQIPRSKREPG